MIFDLSQFSLGKARKFSKITPIVPYSSNSISDRFDCEIILPQILVFSKISVKNKQKFLLKIWHNKL